eukprot:1883435-Rhodomonas_salina.1
MQNATTLPLEKGAVSVKAINDKVQIYPETSKSTPKADTNSPKTRCQTRLLVLTGAALLGTEGGYAATRSKTGCTAAFDKLKSSDSKEVTEAQVGRGGGEEGGETA